MLSTFPDFKALTWADHGEIDELTSQFAPYSEFDSVNMWCWNEKYRAVCRLDDVLIQQVFDETTGETALSFLGQGNVAGIAQMLIDSAAGLQCSPRLRLVPEDVVALDPRVRMLFTVRDEAYDRDHVLSIPEWVTLPGSRYRTVRNHINAFHRRYQAEFRRLALTDPETQRAIHHLFCRWARQKDAVGAPATVHELAAIERLFMIADDARVLGYGLFLGDVMIGFLICERRPGPYAVAHYWKGDRDYRGVYCALLHRVCRELGAAGCTVLNIGQDLGLAGLASAKQSFNPCHHLRKYALAAA